MERSMKYRRFGKTGWSVSEIGYGMWGMAGWTGSNDDESLRSLERALELGVNFFDTAYAYGDGHSEKLLGKLIRANPSTRIYAATKIPPKNQEWPSRRQFSLDDCFPPSHIEDYVHRSLRNLGVSRIDLIQLHTWEDAWLADDRWIKKLEELEKEGLIASIGISMNRWEAWNGIEAVRAGVVDAVQVIYNIFEQSPEDSLFPACQENDVAVIARVPFDEGSLAGTLTKSSRWPEGDWRNTYFVPENLALTVDRVEALKPLVPAGATLPALALRFILANPAVGTIIPGMRKLANVEANVSASNAGPLPAALQQELRKHRWDRKPTKWSQ
jgi:aryl-alcohol dehydrogenase-like predicted oxidoreductase